MNENEILDEEYDAKEVKEKHKQFNYVKYTLIYIILMLLVGSLMTKLMSDLNRDYTFFIGGAFVYVAIALVLGVIKSGILFLVRKSSNEKKNHRHPFWFRLLESSFYIWCVIVIVTFLRNIVF